MPEWTDDRGFDDSRFTRSWGTSVMVRASVTQPASTTVMGMSCSVRATMPGASRPGSRMSRNEERNESMMVGIARARLMIPPAATDPAPM